MRPETKRPATYGKSRSRNAQSDKNNCPKISVPRVTKKPRMNSNMTFESMSSNNLSPPLETVPGPPERLNTCKDEPTAISGQHAPYTGHGESGGHGSPWKKHTNRTATVTPAEGHNLHGSSQTPGAGPPSDFNGSFRNSPDSCSGEDVNIQQMQLKDSLHEHSDWKQHRGETWGLDSPFSPSVRRAPTKQESPLKRKNIAQPHTMANESSPDLQYTTRKHPKSRWTRKRLVDSLGSSEDSKDPAQDNLHIPLPPGTHDRTGCPSSQSNIYPSENVSFAETARQLSSTSSMLRGSRVTYARQRSFLNDNVLLNGFKDGESVTPLERHALISTRPSTFHSQLMDSLDDDEDYEKSDSKPVRSIHELRQAGLNARFRETVELILEDIESSNSASDRCDGYVRLCSRLLEPEFARQFCECGFEERIVESTIEDIDILSASLALCAYSLIFNSGFFSFALSARFWWKITQISPQLLGSDTNFLCLVDQESSTNIAKPVRHSLRTNLPQILSRVCGRQPSDMSPCFLALCGINMFLQNIRQKLRSVAPISTPLLSQLIGLLAAENPEDEGTTKRFEMFTLGLSILDSYTVLSTEPWYHFQYNPFGLLSRLRWLLYPNLIDQDRKLLGLYIRVIMNVTNADPSLCKELATPELVAGLVGIVTEEFCHVPEDSPAKENSTLNIVILALGALTNLAEKNESSRAVFLMSARNSTTFFQLLLQQFSYGIDSLGKAHSVSDVHNNVAVGYLSILLATLCLNEEIRSQAEKTLEKGLTLILSTTEEFLQYHQKVEQESHYMESESDGGAGLSARLEQIISTLRQLHAYHQ